jgi:hypothetical protein
MAAALLIRFAWPALLMAFVLVGVTSPARMVGVVVGLVVVGAAEAGQAMPLLTKWATAVLNF